jgi:hypothetical protein
MMKPLAIALSVAGRDLWGGGDGNDLTNVQYKAVQNYHNEPPLYNEIYSNKNWKIFRLKLLKEKTINSIELLVKFPNIRYGRFWLDGQYVLKERVCWLCTR